MQRDHSPALMVLVDTSLAEILQAFTRNVDYRRARNLLADVPYADLAGREVTLSRGRARDDAIFALPIVIILIQKTINVNLASDGHCNNNWRRRS